MDKLFIVGAGSVGGHIASNWEGYSKGQKLWGFLDDDSSKHGKEFCGYPVLGGLDFLKNYPGSKLIIGIAFSQIKSKIITRLNNIGNFIFPAIISKNAWISNGVNIAEGTIIYPGTAVNYGCEIGSFVVINMNCALGHDVIIGDYTSLAPGVNLGGHTNIGIGVEMGIGTSTKQTIRIEDFAIVGGQAMVIEDIPAYSKSAGVPAKLLLRHEIKKIYPNLKYNTF
ncbi:hypothetical protein P872_09295 [Rhodonellum psychrophilum GCM71 = DSM 17998]|uniref:PglD N-terminal domain-containing protein n=2 Tax=Rhodonellum TaxID=336827 RepID=U5BM26_9BACT|nr:MULTISPECIES: NeuD/PglB/VioB family sugar acetyltransferase [Rhodonellum]ERM81540.1 hypothetical protein P872_09295 [Rhodonellum psychrophilum GCM71 = DSM 17998]SDZ40530.1 sugar O-acyltransferase, sialic acid O-acetyltransferase NeuD family [Rhodonellum ikkaensis]